MIIWFFFISPLIWWITLIGFQVLNQPCILRIKPYLVMMHYPFYILCWIWFAGILFRTYVSLFMRDIWSVVFSYLSFLQSLYFYSTFRFIVKLSRRYRYFPYNPYPYTCIDSPISKILDQSGTFVTADEPTLLYLTAQVLLLIVHYVGLDKYIMICIHHHGIIQSSFTDLKILYCTCSFLSSNL